MMERVLRVAGSAGREVLGGTVGITQKTIKKLVVTAIKWSCLRK